MTDILRLYDRRSDSIREFRAPGDAVKLYVCGITPYDATHFGHAFTFVSFDVLIRYLQYLGHRVRYVQNVTDVDDPLFVKARQVGVRYEDLAKAETEQYVSDMRALNVLPPESFPHASEEIGGMIELATRLLDSGHAYQVDDFVYFAVSSARDYGQISHLDREGMLTLARERGGDPDDPRRRDPLDFLLWRPSSDYEPAFDSPWGPGLPGWHLECSTMAHEYLGAPLDIHGGGSDLIFPHHENENAQSEAASGTEPFAQFWMHTGMVFLGGQKMSKSLGNMVFIRNLLPSYQADALRLYISSCHYRSELQFDEAALERAAKLAVDLARAASMLGGDLSSGIDIPSYRKRFKEQMNDDLDTTGAIQILHELANAIDRANGDGQGIGEAQSALRELGGVLGLRLGSVTTSPLN